MTTGKAQKLPSHAKAVKFLILPTNQQKKTLKCHTKFA